MDTFSQTNLKLQGMANDNETYLQYIRDTENEFVLEEKDVFSMNILQLEAYIDFLDELWNK